MSLLKVIGFIFVYIFIFNISSADFTYLYHTNMPQWNIPFADYPTDKFYES